MQDTIMVIRKTPREMKELAESLILKGYRIISSIYSDKYEEGFFVVNKQVTQGLREKILDWNYRFLPSHQKAAEQSDGVGLEARRESSEGL
jgi:hypothetical protein